MVDVFISYSTVRRADTIRLADQLAAKGFTVWWDKKIIYGQRFRKTIDLELAAARAVIVVWSPESIESDWVLSESQRALKRGVLLPVHTADLDPEKVPPPFDVLHAGPVENIADIVEALMAMGVAPSGASTATQPSDRDTKPWPSRRTVAIGCATAAATIGTTVLALKLAPRPPRPSDRLIRTVGHHDQSVVALAYTDDSRHLVSGSWDETIRWWDAMAENLQEIRRHDSRAGVVWCVAPLPGGTHALAGTETGALQLWASTNSHPVHEWREHQAAIWSVGVTSDAARALTGSQDSTLKLWAVPTGEVLHTFPAKGKVSAAALAKQGGNAVSAAKDLLQFWDMTERSERKTIPTSTAIKAVEILPDGGQVLIGGKDGILRLMDVRSGQPIRSIPSEQGAILAIAVSNTGRTALSGHENGTARLWDLASGAMVATLERHAEPIEAVAIAPDGRTAATGSRDKSILLWDLGSIRRI